MEELAAALDDSTQDPEDYVLHRAISIGGNVDQPYIVLSIIPGTDPMLSSGPVRATTFEGRPAYMIDKYRMNPAALRINMKITVTGSVSFQADGNDGWQTEPLTPEQQEVVDRYCQTTAMHIQLGYANKTGLIDNDQDEEEDGLDPETMSVDDIREMLAETRHEEKEVASGSSPIDKVVSLADELARCQAMAEAILEEVEHVRGPNAELLLGVYQRVNEWTRQAGEANWTVIERLKEEGGQPHAH